MFINHSSKQVTAKIVYYGPGLSGKTTNLQYIFSITNPRTRGELISIETKIERIEDSGDGVEIKIEGEGSLSPYAGATLNRIQTPLMVSGFDELFIKEFDDFFGKRI